MVKKTNSFQETIALGEKIGKKIRGLHAVILLEGDLAAGKTTLTKGIALGLGIKAVVKSPSFVIMRQYESKEKIKLYHLDLYRLDEMGLDFDLEEYVDDLNSVVVIEWPYQVKEILPEEYIKISITGSADERNFEITWTNKYSGVLEEIWKN